MAFGPNKKKNGKGQGGLVGVLDIGTTKIVCLIAKIDEDGQPYVIGMKKHDAAGMRAAAVDNVELAREAIVDTVSAAEKMSGEQILRVFVGLGCGRPRTERVTAEIFLEGRDIGAAEIRRVVDLSRLHKAGEARRLLHDLPVGFHVDKTSGIKDPRGMVGDRLGLDMNLITAEAGPVATMAKCVESGHLEIDAFVVGPYAAGLACLDKDEMALGATVIDMGGGVTGMAVFEEGELVFADAVPIGGQHVTKDIAHGLSTPEDSAEELKRRVGSALPSPADDRELIDVPQMGLLEQGVSNHMPKSMLTGVIKPRIEETFELVRERLKQHGLARAALRRIVLTGGGSELRGARDIAASVLDRPVRLGRPRRYLGLAEHATGPAYAAAIGLLRYATEFHGTGGLAGLGQLAVPEKRGRRRGHATVAAGERGIGRVWKWLHANF